MYGLLKQIEGKTPEVDYIEHEAVLLAQSEKDAKKAAVLLCAQLVSYESGTALIRGGKTVEEMLIIAQAWGEDMPQIQPNFFYSVDL